jgi:hypothetical protein
MEVYFPLTEMIETAKKLFLSRFDCSSVSFEAKNLDSFVPVQVRKWPSGPGHHLCLSFFALWLRRESRAFAATISLSERDPTHVWFS